MKRLDGVRGLLASYCAAYIDDRAARAAGRCRAARRTWYRAGGWSSRRADARSKAERRRARTESARGAWRTENTLVANLATTETPCPLDATFGFDADLVSLGRRPEIRWGSATDPQVVGAR